MSGISRARIGRGTLLHVENDVITLMSPADIPYLSDRGLIERRMGRWMVTDVGRLMIDSLALEGWRLVTSAWRRR